MTEYHVIWRVVVEADSPFDAAMAARQQQLTEPDGRFVVAPVDGSAATTVNLAEKRKDS